jgi:lambda repressor-like predicted transcriptional regulator
MSANPSNSNDALSIREDLQAFFRLDARRKQEVQEQVACLKDPQSSQAERDCAKRMLATALRSTGGKYRAGPVMSREERFSAAHDELRAQLEKTEVAFAATLARLMAERQLTQAQLAERTGVGQSAISMLLNRRCRPQQRTLGKLAEALGVPVEELWPGFKNGWQSGAM